MKVGDKLYCKKSLHDKDDNGDIFIFHIGGWYTIHHIYNDNEVLLEYENSLEGNYYFYIKTPEHKNGHITNKLSDYFYSKKEARKIKLDKINQEI